jgi:hypothetical protein
MSNDVAELLSSPSNFAVVQMPGRQFPGVVMQGDTLNAAILSLQSVRRELRDDETVAELEIVLDQLVDARTHYEHTCASKGIALPYSHKPSS